MVGEGEFVVKNRNSSPRTRQFGLPDRRSGFWMIASNTKVAKAKGTIEGRSRVPSFQALNCAPAKLDPKATHALRWMLARIVASGIM